MSRLRRSLALLVSVMVCCMANAVPKTLIVQYASDKEDASPINMADNLARVLEDSGKMDTIVWSMSDPVFRGAVLDGRLPSLPDQPSVQQMLDVAKTLQCEFAMFVKVELKGTAVAGKLDAYRGGRVVWSDSQEMDPGRASIMDLDNAVRSIARTWAVKMYAGILKHIKAEPRPPETPSPSIGQAPPSPSSQGETAKAGRSDSAAVVAEYQQKMAAGRTSEALIFLRDSIDAHPLDPPLRKAYIRHLQSTGKSAEAAAEARRASELMPENQELRAMAARAFLTSGKEDQALNQLNEALARNPEDAVSRSMAADLAMEGLRLAEALAHLDVAIRVAPAQGLHYRRAAVYGILGNPASALGDLDLAARTPSGVEEWDLFCMSIWDRALEQTVGDIRSLAQRLAVRREDSEARAELDSQLELVQRRMEFLAKWPSTEGHKKSSRRRSLALSLLAQSLSGMKTFVASGNEDTLTDANIDLGEAIKQMKLAREALAAEGKTPKDGSTTVHLND